MNQQIKKFRFRLPGRALVMIDWANVYGWRFRRQKRVNPSKLYKYLKGYKEISEILFYFGEDIHPKSKLFLRKISSVIAANASAFFINGFVWCSFFGSVV